MNSRLKETLSKLNCDQKRDNMLTARILSALTGKSREVQPSAIMTATKRRTDKFSHAVQQMYETYRTESSKLKDLKDSLASGECSVEEFCAAIRQPLKISTTESQIITDETVHTDSSREATDG